MGKLMRIKMKKILMKIIIEIENLILKKIKKKINLISIRIKFIIIKGKKERKLLEEIENV
jgi:hypothetical protein